MNGIEKITGRITGDSDREIAEILKKARASADAVLEANSAEADALARDIIGRGKLQANERVLRLAGVADLEARKMILAAKQEMLEQTFAKAMEDLLNLPEDKYAELLARLAADAVGSGSGELIFSQADRTRLGKKVVAAAIELQKSRQSAAKESDGKLKDALTKTADMAAAATEMLKSRIQKPGITLSEETRPIKGGLLIKDGDVEINCSFEAIMRSMRDDLIKEVSDILFA